MSRRDLVNLIREMNDRKEPRREVRRGLLGRGISSETTTKVSGRETHRWVRNREDQRQVWQVLGGDIPDIINWPVLIERSEIDRSQWIITRSDREGLSQIPGSATGTIGLIGPHHEQHEEHGWDMVNVGKGMIKPLRIRPTTPVSYSVLLEWDDTPYIGNKLLDLEEFDGYETFPIRGVRRSLWDNTGTPPDSRYYLAVLTRDEDLIFITGSAFLFNVGGMNQTVPGSKPDPSVAADYNGSPLAYIFVGATGTAVRYQDIEDIRPLWTPPGWFDATGVYIQDAGNYFTGGNVEYALQEIGFHFDKVKVSFDDTTPNYLQQKITAGPGITAVVQNDGANETLLLSSSPTGASGTFSTWLPDAPPVSPSAFDDEFSDSVLAGTWTEYDIDGVIAVSEDAWGLSILRDATDDFHPFGIYKAGMTGSFAAYTKLSLTSWGGNTAMAGLLFGQDLAGAPTTSDLIFYGLEMSPEDHRLVAYGYPDYVSGTSTLVSYRHVMEMPEIYLRVRWVAGTYYFGYSSRGLGWFEVGSHTGTTAPLHVGLAVYNRNEDSSDQARGVFSFFRQSTDTSITAVMRGDRRVI